MSLIILGFVGIQSADIMADSLDARQILLTLNNKLDWLYAQCPNRRRVQNSVGLAKQRIDHFLQIAETPPALIHAPI